MTTSIKSKIRKKKLPELIKTSYSSPISQLDRQKERGISKLEKIFAQNRKDYSGLLSPQFASKEKYFTKDNFWTADFFTTASSQFLANFLPGQNAFVIRLLARRKLNLLGKTALDEFACGGTGLLASTGIITNPHNSRHITGGSSSGSAAAVVQKLVPFALGSDTGGSVRQPAAYCGAIGFKPSPGLISRSGLIPLAASLDAVGILADSVTRTKKIFSLISQPDPNDLLTIASPKNNSVKPALLASGKKVAVLKGVENYLSSEFAKLYQRSINILKKNKYQFKAIQIPSQVRENLQLAYLIISSSELVSHLNSCQGITFGKKMGGAGQIEKPVQQVRSKYLGKSVCRRLILGSYFLQKKKDYDQACFFRQRVQNWAEQLFSKSDFLLFPSPNSEAPKIKPSNFFSLGSKTHWSDNLLLLANFAGLPSLNLPIGLVNKLPVSININGAYGKDRAVLELSQILEKEIAKL